MAVDIQRIFAEEIPALLTRHAATCRTIGATYQIDICGDSGGAWFLDVSETGPSLSPVRRPADCEITIDAIDFQQLYEDPHENGLPFFLDGRLKVTGNHLLVVKLQILFDLIDSARNDSRKEKL